MDEAELEDWFVEERGKLEEKFLAALQVHKKPDAAKIEFDKRYRALIAKYQHEQQAIYERKRTVESIRTPIAKMRARITDMHERITAWFARRKTAIRTWFFERKIQRILRDKRDMYHEHP